MHKIILTAGVIIIKNNKVLLVKHGEGAGHLTGVYGLPAGRMEEGETELQTARRELFEETGLSAQDKDFSEFPENDYVADIKRKSGEINTYSIKFFICYKYSGELKENEENIPEWIDINLMDKLNLLPNVHRAAMKAKEYLDGQKI
jgi:8-oxo-dGTP pyrophosphatase MutT (NUDIX family)